MVRGPTASATMGLISGEAMQVIVNGERTEVEATNLRDLLEEFDFDGSHVAVTVNTHTVPRARWAATNLETGDEIAVTSPHRAG